jgi:hypothetical protein
LGKVPAAASLRNDEKLKEIGKYFVPHSAMKGTSE